MTARLTAIDLCCSAGLASEGYAEHFEMTGVDVDPQPHYPHEFIEQDVTTLDPAWLATFDLVVGSPPCQRYTGLRHRYTVNNHPDLIAPVRELMRASGRPYVIENVEGARSELLDPIMLCGTMFPGLRVKRHRYFEVSGFDLPQPEHMSKHPLHHTLDKRKPHYGKTDEMVDFVMVNGGGNCSVRAARDAMGLNHRPELTKHELNEGIPPAYTAYIARHAAAALGMAAAA